MAAGKRYKFNPTEIQFLTSFDESSPGPMSVSAITKANPAVVTVNDTSVLGSTDDIGVVKLSSVEGMTEVDEQTYLVQVINGTTFRLLGVDSSGYGTFSGTALAYPGVFSNWCEVNSFNRQGGTSPEIPATTNCSTYAEFEIGLPDFGTVQVEFNYAPSTAVQQALDAFQQSGEKTALHYSLANNGGERYVLGFIQQTGEQGSNGSLWTGSMTFRSTGAPVTVLPA